MKKLKKPHFNEAIEYFLSHAIESVENNEVCSLVETWEDFEDTDEEDDTLGFDYSDVEQYIEENPVWKEHFIEYPEYLGYTGENEIYPALAFFSAIQLLRLTPSTHHKDTFKVTVDLLHKMMPSLSLDQITYKIIRGLGIENLNQPHKEENN